MEKNNAMLMVGGLAVVAVIVASLLSFNALKQGGMNAMHMDMMKTPSMEEMNHSSMTMDQMTKGLKGKTGDAFDRAFIEMMIVHHQGAVEMAELIPAHAKHEELKKLGRDIITAQTQEIAMMRQWLKEWGYEGSATKTQPEMMDEMMPGMKH